MPIVEPEVLMDADNTIEVCYEVTLRTLQHVFRELDEQRVSLEGMLLKPNMVVSGKQCPVQAGAQQVAELTLKCFREVIPAAVPGIVFLSGGQSDVQATENLNAINSNGAQPWTLSFSYGRALQAPALKAWAGGRRTSRRRRPRSPIAPAATARPSPAATRPSWRAWPGRRSDYNQGPTRA